MRCLRSGRRVNRRCQAARLPRARGASGGAAVLLPKQAWRESAEAGAAQGHLGRGRHGQQRGERHGRRRAGGEGARRLPGAGGRGHTGGHHQRLGRCCLPAPVGRGTLVSDRRAPGGGLAHRHWRGDPGDRRPGRLQHHLRRQPLAGRDAARGGGARPPQPQPHARHAAGHAAGRLEEPLAPGCRGAAARHAARGGQGARGGRPGHVGLAPRPGHHLRAVERHRRPTVLGHDGLRERAPLRPGPRHGRTGRPAPWRAWRLHLDHGSDSVEARGGSPPHLAGARREVPEARARRREHEGGRAGLRHADPRPGGPPAFQGVRLQGGLRQRLRLDGALRRGPARGRGQASGGVGRRRAHLQA